MKYFLLLIFFIQLSWATVEERVPISLSFNFSISEEKKDITFYGISNGQMKNFLYVINGDTINVLPQKNNIKGIEFDGLYVSRVENLKKDKFICIIFFLGSVKNRTEQSFLLIDSIGNYTLYPKIPLEYKEIEPVKIKELFIKESQVFDVFVKNIEITNKKNIAVSAYLFKDTKESAMNINGFNAFSYSNSSISLINLCFGLISNKIAIENDDISVLYSGIVEKKSSKNAEKKQVLRKKENIDSLLKKLQDSSVNSYPYIEKRKKY